MKKALKDLRSECACEREKYCPLEALLSSMSDRVLEQHKLVEYFVYTQIRQEISWDEAYNLWITQGHAKKFAEIYSPDKTYKQMREEMFGK